MAKRETIFLSLPNRFGKDFRNADKSRSRLNGMFFPAALRIEARLDLTNAVPSGHSRHKPVHREVLLTLLRSVTARSDGSTNVMAEAVPLKASSNKTSFSQAVKSCRVTEHVPGPFAAYRIGAPFNCIHSAETTCNPKPAPVSSFINGTSVSNGGRSDGPFRGGEIRSWPVLKL